MATSREERMASRLRGAGRHIVEDISFGFVLPDPEPSIITDPPPAPVPEAEQSAPAASPQPPPPTPPPPAPVPRSANPNTSAKRRRIAADGSREPVGPARTPAAPPPVPLPTTRSGRTSSAAARPDPYDALSQKSTVSTRSRPSPRSSTRSGPATDALRRSIAARTPGREGEDVDGDEDDMESLPRPTPRTGQGQGRVGVVATEEVVQESPADAPGSGQRRRVVRVSEVAIGSGAVLQRVMQEGGSSREQRRGLTREEGGGEEAAEGEEEEEDEITAEMDVDLGVGSSPLVRKVAQREKERKEGKTAETTMEKTAGKSVRNVGKKPAGQKGEKSASRRTARRSGAGAAGFGLDEVDELSPAPAPPAPSPAVAGKRSVRLSGASADGGVDELSPAVARTMRRSVRPPTKAVVEAGVAEPSPAPAKTAKRSVGRPRKSMAEGVDAPSPASTKAAKRSIGRPPKTAAEDVVAPSPARARSNKRNAKALVDTRADELDGPSPAPARTARRSVRMSDGSAVLDEVDELSPEKTHEVMGPPPARLNPQKDVAKTKQSAKQPEEAPSKSTPKAHRAQKPKTKPTEVQPVEEAEEAEEIDATEAAHRLGRKRPRRSIAAPAEAEEHEQQEDKEEPPAKRRRGKPPQSPAAQQPPKTRKEKKATAAAVSQPKKPPAKRKKTRPAAPAGDDDELQEGGGTFPITVQRFTKRVQYSNDSDGEADILGSGTIPFASRAGVNAVDVLAQICEELVASFLSNLHEQGRNAADAAARREVKTMMRTLELFGDELRTRLLEHTIALDTLHALRKRVRQAQRDKVALREEILRIRREKEGVELRKDAVRVRHEGERAVALANINLSSAMHDVDLAVEKGLAAEPLSEKEESKANLANLEFLISKVAEQACSKSDQGGTLKQIKDFNAFLERAAAALEGR